MLDEHYSRTDVANKLRVKYDTLRKAINDGRLKESKTHRTVTTKSFRNTVGAKAADGLGTSCTRTVECSAAAVGEGDGAIIRFEPCLDVLKGGVFCGLPALLANGLLHGAEFLLGEVHGYYRTLHILLLLAFISLCRIKKRLSRYEAMPRQFGSCQSQELAASPRHWPHIFYA